MNERLRRELEVRRENHMKGWAAFKRGFKALMDENTLHVNKIMEDWKALEEIFREAGGYPKAAKLTQDGDLIMVGR